MKGLIVAMDAVERNDPKPQVFDEARSVSEESSGKSPVRRIYEALGVEPKANNPKAAKPLVQTFVVGELVTIPEGDAYDNCTGGILDVEIVDVEGFYRAKRNSSNPGEKSNDFPYIGFLNDDGHCIYILITEELCRVNNKEIIYA